MTGERPDGPVIEVEHLHKAYGATVAVDDVSFSVRRGEIFGSPVHLGVSRVSRSSGIAC